MSFLTCILTGVAAAAAAVLLLRKSYTDQAAYKSFLAETADARERAVYSQVVQGAYSDGWNAGYKKAREEFGLLSGSRAIDQPRAQ